MSNSSIFRQVINTHYDFRRNILTLRDFQSAVSTFVSQVLSASGSTYLKSLTRQQVHSIDERIASIIDAFPGSFPYTESNYHGKQINKLENQPCPDSYSYLWRDSNKIFLGSFHPYGIDGPRKDISTSIYLDSTNANVLVDVKTMTRGQEKVSRFCFPDCNDVYAKRPGNSYFMQSAYNDIENIFYTDRFDPFHIGRESKEDHTNKFPQRAKAEELSLFQKYFQPTAKTPHIHFYYESVCNGEVLPGADGHKPKGNDKSLAINLGNLSLYINDICKEIQTYDSTKPLPEILANDLGMPYLSILYGSTSFNSSYFISKVKRLPNIDPSIKQDIVKRLNSASMLKLSLQFFAEKYTFLPDIPKEPHKKALAIKQLKKLALAYEFINNNSEILTAGEQRALLSAINEGLSQHINAKDIIDQNHLNYDFEDQINKEDDFEPIL